MRRRDFLRNSLMGGLAGAAAMSIGKYGNVFGQTTSPATHVYDLAAIKGGEPDAMFDKAIQALGGMERFVKKGQKVVVKPNIGWDVVPEKAANTNPILVKRIVEHCLKAGAKEVYVFDNTCDDWQKAYKNSGIEQAVKDAGGKMAPGNDERYYHEKEMSTAKKLKKAKIHELILESDVFINVPVLKSHGSAKLTMSMKNLMGIVWDRKFWHKNDLNQCIADFVLYKKPDLNIIDAYNVMKNNGPRGVSIEDVVSLKSQIISADIVAADVAATKIFGLEPDQIPYILMAEKMGLGTKNLDELSISRMKM